MTMATPVVMVIRKGPNHGTR